MLTVLRRALSGIFILAGELIAPDDDASEAPASGAKASSETPEVPKPILLNALYGKSKPSSSPHHALPGSGRYFMTLHGLGECFFCREPMVSGHTVVEYVHQANMGGPPYRYIHERCNQLVGVNVPRERVFRRRGDIPIPCSECSDPMVKGELVWVAPYGTFGVMCHARHPFLRKDSFSSSEHADRLTTGGMQSEQAGAIPTGPFSPRTPCSMCHRPLLPHEACSYNGAKTAHVACLPCVVCGWTIGSEPFVRRAELTEQFIHRSCGPGRGRPRRTSP